MALWATQRLFPLVRGGEFAGMLDSCRAAALKFHNELAGDKRFIPAFPPELDIVVWAAVAETPARSSELAHQFFDGSAAKNDHLALAQLPLRLFRSDLAPDAGNETIACLRSVLMKH